MLDGFGSNFRCIVGVVFEGTPSCIREIERAADVSNAVLRALGLLRGTSGSHLSAQPMNTPRTTAWQASSNTAPAHSTGAEWVQFTDVLRLGSIAQKRGVLLTWVGASFSGASPDVAGSDARALAKRATQAGTKFRGPAIGLAICNDAQVRLLIRASDYCLHGIFGCRLLTSHPFVPSVF